MRDLEKAYGPVQVLRGVTLEAPVGRITGLLGPNGAGKTTLFRIVMGLTRADGGDARIGDTSVLGLPLHRKASVGMGYLPQECASFPELTVRDNLLALVELAEPDRARHGPRLDELVELAGLDAVADRRYGELSGGERRRVEVAKAFAARPRLLLLDEPFSGLDPLIIEDLARIFRRLAESGVGILLTDHHVHMALGIVDYAYLLADGRILCDGTPEEIGADADARRAYLGASFVARR